MTVWSFGDMFAPDPDSRIGVEVDLFSLDAGKNVEGPESSRWWAAWCMMVGVVALALFWGSELFAMAWHARRDGWSWRFRESTSDASVCLRRGHSCINTVVILWTYRSMSRPSRRAAERVRSAMDGCLFIFSRN